MARVQNTTSVNSAFCPLLEMQTSFWIKFGLSTEIGRQNLFDLKFYNFDTFSSVGMRKKDDLFKRKWQVDALIYCMVLLVLL